MHEALEKMQDQRAKMQRDLQKKLGEYLDLTHTAAQGLCCRRRKARIDQESQYLRHVPLSQA